MWTIESFKKIYDRYETSGLSVSDFVSNEHICRSRFYYWQKKYKKQKQSDVSLIIPTSENIINNIEENPRFIPIMFESENQDKKESIKPIRQEASYSRQSLSFMEISYPNGTQISLSGEKDMELIKTLILLSR
jgi:hypothetical protein